jgi:uncharacterized Zn finger protein (UPF0148 family)
MSFKFSCPACFEPYNPGATICPHCRTNIPKHWADLERRLRNLREAEQRAEEAKQRAEEAKQRAEFERGNTEQGLTYAVWKEQQKEQRKLLEALAAARRRRPDYDYVILWIMIASFGLIIMAWWAWYRSRPS